jgi:hypothetical protein
MTLQTAKIKWINDCKILAGDFKPSTAARSTSKVNRSLLPDIVQYLSKKLSEDWEDTIFAITTNPEDLVEIKFKSDTVESVEGLHAYMNVLMANDDHVNEYKLRKVVQNWDLTDAEGNIYYQIAPPWVRIRVTDAYYTLFPDRIPRHSTNLTQAGFGSTSPRMPTMYSLREDGPSALSVTK